MGLTTVGYTDFSGTIQIGSGPGATSSLTLTIPTTPQSDLCVAVSAGEANGTGTLSALTAQASGGPVKSATLEPVSGLWIVNVPSGTTSVTFVGTFTGGTDQLQIVYIHTTTGDAAPTWGTGTDTGVGFNSGSCSVNAGGVVFALGSDQSAATCNITSGATQDGHPASVTFGASSIVAGHNDSAGGGTVTVNISASAANGEVILAPLNPGSAPATPPQGYRWNEPALRPRRRDSFPVAMVPFKPATVVAQNPIFYTDQPILLRRRLPVDPPLPYGVQPPPPTTAFTFEQDIASRRPIHDVVLASLSLSTKPPAPVIATLDILPRRKQDAWIDFKLTFTVTAKLVPLTAIDVPYRRVKDAALQEMIRQALLVTASPVFLRSDDSTGRTRRVITADLAGTSIHFTPTPPSNKLIQRTLVGVGL